MTSKVYNFYINSADKISGTNNNANFIIKKQKEAVVAA